MADTTMIEAKGIKLGALVTVLAAKVADEWTGQTFRAVGIDGRDVLLCPAEWTDVTAHDYTVAINVNRLLPA